MYDIITFDCYGTLIDWEGGICGALSESAKSVGFDVPRDEVMRAYLEVEPTIQAEKYRSYRDILGDAASETAQKLGWTVEPEKPGFLADSLTGWTPFADTNQALEQLKEDGYRLGILSNIDNDLLAGTLEHLTVEFEFLITAESVRSYKPAHEHFLKAREYVEDSSWLHAAQSYFHDIVPACALGIPVVWVNRNGDAPAGVDRPTGEVPTLSGLVHWLNERSY